MTEVETLVLFHVITALQNLSHHLIIRYLINLDVLQHIFRQCQGWLHILTQPREADVNIIARLTHIEVTSQFVEFLLNL